MTSVLRDAEIAAALEYYRDSRGIDAGSPEWDHMLAWHRKNHGGDTLVYAQRLDAELARFRRGGDRPHE